MPTKAGDDDLANWQWGGTLVVHEVYQRTDGTLGVKAPEGVESAFTQSTTLIDTPVTLSATDACRETSLSPATGDLFKLNVDVTFSADTRSFGIRLCEDLASGEAYEFVFLVGEQRVLFDRTPNLPWYRYMNKGLERPLHLEGRRTYHIQIIVDDTIATLYVDGVALNTRMYAKAGQALAVYVVDGILTVETAFLRRGCNNTIGLGATKP